MIEKVQDLSYENVVECISQAKHRFPFAGYSVIGRTWCSRAIFSACVGSGEESVLFCGGFGASDKLSSLVLMRFFERLCLAYESDLKISGIKIRNALGQRKICFVPLLNPDSLEISRLGGDGAGCYRGLVTRAANGNFVGWRSNARGVDVAKNFDYDFPKAHGGIYPSPLGCIGPAPSSEAETKALEILCEKQFFRHVVLLSSPGEKIFYNTSSAEVDTSMIAKVFESVCEYKCSQKSEEEKQGGFCEWFSECYSRPSYEIRTGKSSELTDRLFAETYPALEELLTLAAIM